MNSPDTPSYPPVYRNKHLVEGLLVYIARLKGELKRAVRDQRNASLDQEAVRWRRSYYAHTLESATATLLSLEPDIDIASVKAKVTMQEDYRTTKSDLRIAILRALKRNAEPVSTNHLHQQVIDAMGLTLATSKERAKHRAVLVEALHDLRRGTPAVVEAMEQLEFGKFDQPEQRWRLIDLRA